MLRKSMIALAAVAALGLTAVASTDALAKGGKGGFGWKGGGFHHHHGYGLRRGISVGFYGPAYYAPSYDCYRVITPRGRIKLVCSY